MSEYCIRVCSSKDDFEIAKNLTKDYMNWLGIDLCFQNIDKEFRDFENMYGGSKGCFLYIIHKEEVAGGVGLRFFDKGICEMKRLFVYEDFRGKGYGKSLCKAIVEKARTLGYDKMVLDTVQKLKAANFMYESMGFVDIPPYYDNPEETVRYMGLDLYGSGE